MAPSGEDRFKNKFGWYLDSIFPDKKPEPVDQHDRLARQFQNVGLESKQKATIPEYSGKSPSDGSSGSSMQQRHPSRPDAKDCLFYIQTGTCKFGPTCKFNHPVPKNIQVHQERGKGKTSEVAPGKWSPIPCKYYQSGLCKKGDSCRFDHSIPEVVESMPLQLNVLGLPFRLGEMECSFYMRTGTCGYGAKCRYHHPQPIFFDDPQTFSALLANGSLEYLDGTSGITDGGYIMRFPESTQPYYPPPAIADSSFQYLQPSSVLYGYETDPRTALEQEKVLERTQEMIINVPKTQEMELSPPVNGKMVADRGKDLPPIKEPCVLSDVGLPLRPGNKVCWYYENLGLCKLGRACAYDHPPRHSSNVREGSTSKSASGSGGKTTKTKE